MGRTNLLVNFTAPYGGKRNTFFPMVIKDYWPALEYADRLQTQTFGTPTLQDPCKCLNTSALDFTRINVYSTDTLRTLQNGELFIIDEKKGCGSGDTLHEVSP